jgi:hypothetical protein
MNIEIFKKLKSIQWSSHKDDVYDRREGLRPGQDWTWILSSTFIGIIVAGCIALYLNIMINNGSLFSTPITDGIVGSVVLNEQGLDTFVETTKHKESWYAELKQKGPALLDPSL